MSDLLSAIGKAYAHSEGGELSNRELRDRLVRDGVVDEASLRERVQIGKERHSPAQIRLRWAQQSLRAQGLLERDKGCRGRWRLTAHGHRKYTEAAPGAVLLACSTSLGIAIWARNEDVFSAGRGIDVPLGLMITSPPYPLQKARAYGNPPEHEYVDFICRALEGVLKNLVDGGSVVLNVTNDAFLAKSPERSIYKYRLVVALHDRLGLHLMDEQPWVNKSKAPGPIQWASLRRVQMNVAYEPCLWFTNNPHAVRADNRRILEPHSKEHLALIARGGENRRMVTSDGAYRLKPGSFGRPTAGRIPRNVIEAGHRCPGQTLYKRAAGELGLPVHGAPMPESVAERWIRFLTDPADPLPVADIFAGTLTVPAVCERLGIPWVAVDMMAEPLRAGAERLRWGGAQEFELGPELEAWYEQFRKGPPENYALAFGE